MQDDAAKRWDDSLISLGLGALVVVVSGILIYNFFSGQTPQLLKKTQTQVVTTAAPAASVTQVAEKPSGSPSETTKASTVAIAKPTAPVKATTAPSPVITASPVVTAKPSTPPNATVQPTSSAQPSAVAAVQAPSTGQSLPAKHIVVAGDSFWKISTHYYGTGYEWHRIADANKVAATTGLKVGAEIDVPRAELISATSTVKASMAPQVAQASTAPSVSPKPSTVAQASVAPSSTPVVSVQSPGQVAQQPVVEGSKTYTVVAGDSMWKIAQSQCANPYAWSSIAKQNKLINASIIHPGNTFTFTCN